MSPDEYSDYDDMDYVPDTSGNSSEESICSTEHRITDSLVSPKEDMPVKDAVQIEEITTSAIASSHSISVTSCSATSSGNALESNSAIKVTPLPKGAKQSKYNKKQYCSKFSLFPGISYFAFLTLAMPFLINNAFFYRWE